MQNMLTVSNPGRSVFIRGKIEENENTYKVLLGVDIYLNFVCVVYRSEMSSWHPRPNESSK